MALEQLISKISPNKLFLVDSMGAVLTAFMLGCVLASFESMFGMPESVLHVLALIACIFAVYSFVCYLRLKENWRPYLKAIAIANLSYCVLSLGCVVYYYELMSALGVLYFVLEVIIVIPLVGLELKVASN